MAVTAAQLTEFYKLAVGIFGVVLIAWFDGVAAGAFDATNFIDAV